MRAFVVLALAAVVPACSNPPALPDVADANVDAPAAEDVPAVDAPNPRAPLSYRPAGCGYDVTTTPGTTNNRMGDDATFGAMATPRSVHVNWASDPSTTAAVLWSTDAATLATVVEYGTSMTTLDRTARGHVSTAGSALGSVTVHEVHLCGLRPDTTYYYRVGGPGHFSPVYHFKTAPTPGGSEYDVNFVVVGDSRPDAADPSNFPRDWRMIQQRIASVSAMRQPDFQLFTGDAVSLGLVQSEWDQWFEAARDTLANMPWVFVHGNHEGIHVNYLAQFAQPQDHGELYFSFDYGPIHFVVLNDSPPAPDALGRISGEYAAWLEADLRAVDRSRTPWVIATHHKGPYTTSTHSDDTDVGVVRSAWTPLYDRYHVNVVLNGHDHSLHVTRPLRAGMPTTAAMGTVYVVSGGAGAPLYGVRSDTMLYQHVESTLNFVMVHATERVLELTPYRGDGTTVAEARVTLTAP
jgi:hypothetical protein